MTTEFNRAQPPERMLESEPKRNETETKEHAERLRSEVKDYLAKLGYKVYSHEETHPIDDLSFEPAYPYINLNVSSFDHPYREADKMFFVRASVKIVSNAKRFTINPHEETARLLKQLEQAFVVKHDAGHVAILRKI